MVKTNLFKSLLQYFLQGLLYIGPLTVTIYAIYVTFQWLDGFLYHYIEQYFGVKIPGLGLLTVLIAITFVGFLGSRIVFRPFVAMMDKAISGAPLIKIIYTSVKDLLSAFVGQKKRFSQPVLVKVSADGELEKVGFITNEDLSELGISEKKVAVYLPHSYAWSGNLFIVPAKNVTKINASATDVMKYIISGGVTKLNQ
jgi:uncharacterized membrane protein